MTVPLISLYSGEVPNPNTQGPEVFSTNAVDWTNYQALNLGVDINATVTQFNIDIETVNSYAQSAEESASTSASNANFKGRWVDASGAATVPSSYSHSGKTWQLLQNITDITLDEPNDISANWQAIIPDPQTAENTLTISTVLPHTVTGTVKAGGMINQIRASIPLFTPLADSVPEKTILVVELPVWLANETPSLSVMGGDKLIGKDGEDTDGRIDWVGPARLTLTSNGVDEWSL